MNRREFATAIAVLAKSRIPAMRFDDATNTVWFSALRDLDLIDLQRAIQAFIQNGDDFPSISKIRKLAGAVIVNPQSAAWLVVVESMRRVGGYESVQFDDPIINAVVKALGGWPNLCLCANDELSWKRKDFESLYKSLESVPVLAASHSGPLVGLHGHKEFLLIETGLPNLRALPPKPKGVGWVAKNLALQLDSERKTICHNPTTTE